MVTTTYHTRSLGDPAFPSLKGLPTETLPCSPGPRALSGRLAETQKGSSGSKRSAFPKPAALTQPLLHSQLHFFEWIKWSALNIPRASKLQTSAAKARTPWASGTLRKVRDHAFRAGDVGDSELPDGLPLAVLTSLGGLRTVWTKRPTIDWTKKAAQKTSLSLQIRKWTAEARRKMVALWRLHHKVQGMHRSFLHGCTIGSFFRNTRFFQTHLGLKLLLPPASISTNRLPIQTIRPTINRSEWIVSKGPSSKGYR